MMKRGFSNPIFAAIGLALSLAHGAHTATLSESLSSGIVFLRSQQDTAGFWTSAERVSTGWRDTVIAAEAFRVLIGTGDAVHQKAMEFLSGQSPTATRQISRQLFALAKGGRDVSGLVPRLVSQARPFGSGAVFWAGDDLADRERRILETAWALRALVSANHPDINLLLKAANFLFFAQGQDGGWAVADVQTNAHHELLVSDDALTAIALIALDEFGLGEHPKSALARQYLIQRQNQDGGFGRRRTDSGNFAEVSTIWETAWVYQALAPHPEWIPVNNLKAQNYILTRQAQDGSWSSSVHDTALALLALAAGRPNLQVAERAISVIPNPAFEGDTVRVVAFVTNGGAAPAFSVNVRFLVDGTVAWEVVLPEIAIGETAQPEISWPTAGHIGTHTFQVVVDPENVILETVETDNKSGLETLSVLESQFDFSVTTATPDSFSPTAGDTVTLRATLINLGKNPASVVLVGFFDGDPSAGGILIATQTVLRLEPQSPVEIQQSWFTEGQGGKSHRIFVLIDPNNLFVETDEANNAQSFDIFVSSPGQLVEADPVTGEPKVVALPDLGYLSVSLSPSIAQKGETVTISGVVKNKGLEPSIATLVRVLDGAGGPSLGETTLSALTPIATESFSISFVPSVGTHTIFVLIDPEDVVRESNEGNNSVSLSLLVDVRPDLSMRAGDITFSHSQLVEGENVTVRMVVRNEGEAPSPQTTLQFFHGDPQTAGELLGEAPVSALLSGTSAAIFVSWRPPLGENLFFVRVDPQNSVPEVSEVNNSTGALFTFTRGFSVGTFRFVAASLLPIEASSFRAYETAAFEAVSPGLENPTFEFFVERVSDGKRFEVEPILHTRLDTDLGRLRTFALWKVTNFSPGTYRVKARLKDPATGEILDSGEKEFEVLPTVSLENAIMLVEPRFIVSEKPDQSVLLKMNLFNLSNRDADLEILYKIKSPSGEILREGHGSATLLGSQTFQQVFVDSFTFLFEDPGTFLTEFHVLHEGREIFVSARPFTVYPPPGSVTVSKTVAPELISPLGAPEVKASIRVEGKFSPIEFPKSVLTIGAYNWWYVCAGMFEFERDTIHSYLSEMGANFSHIREPFEGITPEMLEGFDVVHFFLGGFYGNNTMWHPRTLQTFLDAIHKKNISVLVTFDGQAFDINRASTTAGPLVGLQDLTRWVTPTLQVTGSYGQTMAPALPDHPIVSGPFGNIPEFKHLQWLHNIENMGLGEDVIFRSRETGMPMILAYQGASARAVMMRPNIIADMGGGQVYTGTVPENIIKPLYKNIISYLAAKGVTQNLLIEDKIPAEPSVVLDTASVSGDGFVGISGEEGGAKLIKWFFPGVRAGDVHDLSYKMTLPNPIAGESRLVNERLSWSFTNAFGETVQRSSGPWHVHVADVALEAAIRVDKAQYTANEIVIATVTLKSHATFSHEVVVGVDVLDSEGGLVEALPGVSVSISPFEAGLEVGPFVWNTGRRLDGRYSAKARISDSATVASGEAPFDILPVKNLSTRLFANQKEYLQNETAKLSASVINESENHAFQQIEAVLTVRREETGDVVFTTTQTILGLDLGVRRDFSYLFPITRDHPAGDYIATLTAFEQGETLAQSTATFLVKTRALPGVFTGKLSISPLKLYQDQDDLFLSFVATNTGSVSLPSAQFILEISSDLRSAPAMRFVLPAKNIEPGASVSFSTTVFKTPLPGRFVYSALFRVEGEGIFPQIIDVASFEVFVDTQPPITSFAPSRPFYRIGTPGHEAPGVPGEHEETSDPNLVPDLLYANTFFLYILSSVDTGNPPIGVSTTSYRIERHGDPPPPARTYESPLNIQEEGKYKIFFHSVDAFGNTEAEKVSDEFVVDATPPTAELSISSGPSVFDFSETFVTSNTTFTITATDFGHPPSGVTFIVFKFSEDTSVLWDELHVHSPKIVAQHHIQASALKDGEFPISYWPIDTVRNIGELRVSRFVLDNTAPKTALTIGEPQFVPPKVSSLTWTRSNTPLTLFASDNLSGIKEIRYRIDSGDWVSVSAAAGKILSLETTFSLSGQEGERALEWQSFDRLGNEENIQKALFVVDDSPPQTTHEIGEPQATDEKGDFVITSLTPFRLSSHDQGVFPSGLATLQWRLDGGNWQETFGTFFVMADDGFHNVEFRGIDNLGTEEPPPRTISFRLDNTPPDISSATVSPNPFSPNGDGRREDTTLSALLSEFASWTILIKDSQFRVVRVFQENNFVSGISALWDGKDALGQDLPDETYQAFLEAVDRVGNRSVVNLAGGAAWERFTTGFITDTNWEIIANQLHLTGRTSNAGKYGALGVVSQGQLDWSKGSTILRVRTIFPRRPPQASRFLRGEVYLLGEKDTRFVNSERPAPVSRNFLRFAGRASSKRIHWLLQRRRPHNVTSGWLATSLREGDLSTLVSLWRVELDGNFFTVFRQNKRIYGPKKHKMNFQKAALALANRTNVGKSPQTVIFDQIDISRPTGLPVQIDRVPPQSLVNHPANGQELKLVDLASLSGTAKDPEPASGVENVKASLRNLQTGEYFDGSAWTSGGEAFFPVSGRESWKFLFEKGAIRDPGRYLARSLSEDVAENRETPGSGNIFALTLQPLEVTIFSPREGGVIGIGGRPEALAFYQGTGFKRLIYIDSSQNIDLSQNQIVFMDADNHEVLGRIDSGTGRGASGIAIDHERGLAYVANTLSRSIDVFDIQFMEPVRSLFLRRGSPTDIALSTASERLYYIGTPADEFVRAIPNTDGFGVMPIWEARVGAPLRRLLYSSQQNRLFVSVGKSSFEDGHVAILDAQTGDILARISVRDPFGMALDEKGGRLFVAARSTSTLIDASFLRLDTVAVIDTAISQRIATIEGFNLPTALTFHAPSKRLYAVSAGEGLLVAVDANTLQVIGRTALAGLPGNLAGLASFSGLTTIDPEQDPMKKKDRVYAAGSATGILSFVEDDPAAFFAGSFLDVRFLVTPSDLDPNPSSFAQLVHQKGERGSELKIPVFNRQRLSADELRDGFWALHLQASDAAGNQTLQGSGLFEVRLATPPVVGDVLAPRTSLSLSSPFVVASSTYVSVKTSFTLTSIDDFALVGDAVGLGVKRMTALVDGALISAFDNPAPAVGQSFSSTFSLSGVTDGARTVSFFSEDTSANIEPTQSEGFVVDNAPPQSALSISTPSVVRSDGLLLISTRSIFSLTSQDTINALGVSPVGLSFIERSFDAQAPIRHFSPAASFFALGLADGLHALEFFGEDLLTNRETTQRKDFGLDGTAPITTIVAGVPQSAQGTDLYVSTETPVSFSAVDPVSQDGVASGVKSTFFKFTSSDPAVIQDLSSLGLSTNSFVNVSSTQTFFLPEGIITVEAFSEDALENREGVVSQILRVDKTAPSTTLSVGQPQADQSLIHPEHPPLLVSEITPFTFQAFDPQVRQVASGVDKTEFSFDAGSFQIYAATFTAFSLSDGTHTLQWASQDRVENKETISSLAFELDKTSPVVSLTFPDPSAHGICQLVNGIIPVVGSATDIHFVSYRVEAGAGVSPSTFTLIFQSSQPVSNGTLATWDTSSFSGFVTLKLSAEDLVGHTASTQTIVFVGQPDVKLTFGDLPGENHPRGVTFDEGGQRYFIADTNRNTIDIFSSSGNLLSSIGQQSQGQGGLFNKPHSVALLPGGSLLWVADYDNHRVVKLTDTGAVIQTIGKQNQSGNFQPGSDPGEFNKPSDVILDSQGNLWVADSLNSRIQVFDSAGIFIFQMSDASLGHVYGVALDKDERIFVTDEQNGNVLVFASSAALPTVFASGLAQPQDIFVTTHCLLVAERNADRLVLYDLSGRIQGTIGSSGNQPGEFNKPAGVHVLASGDIAVADTNNSRIQVLGVPSPSGGSSSSSSSQGPSSAPKLLAPAPSGDPTFMLREVYAFPNPARGGRNPTIHAEVGIADTVEIRIFDLSGQAIHSAELTGTPPLITDSSGTDYAYEYTWDVSGVAPGVYLYLIRAHKDGEMLKTLKKIAVVK